MLLKDIPDIRIFVDWMQIDNSGAETGPGKYRGYWCHGFLCGNPKWPLLLTWFNFNPSMDK